MLIEKTTENARWVTEVTPHGHRRVKKNSKYCDPKQTNSKCTLDLPAKMQPADHMSIEVVYSLAPNKTSGGRYHNVTTSAE
jgi:hypothetical protein